MNDTKQGNGPATGIIPQASHLPAIPPGQAAQQIRTQYATAVRVQEPRNLAQVEEVFLREADLAGDSFYYAWGAGKDRIEGPSVDLAMAFVRYYGNCAVEMQPVQETRDAWVFTAAFVDLETGFTLTRQFRQSKGWTVYGKFDADRKDDIRFQIGQSKAIRNVVVNALPKWLTRKAIDRAKAGVQRAVMQAVEKYGADAVRDKALAKLEAVGVTGDMVLRKYKRPTLKAITVEDLVLLRADLTALESGTDTLENVYPAPEPEDSGDAKGSQATGTKAERLADEVAAKKSEEETGDSESADSEESFWSGKGKTTTKKSKA